MATPTPMSISYLAGSSVFIISMLLASPGNLHAQDFSGKTVTSIKYEPAAQAVDARDLKAIQLVQTGEPLDMHAVAGTIDRLYASGLYDDIQVDAEPTGEGVSLTFITRARRFIGHVGAQGKISDPPSRGVILGDAQLTLGTQFDAEALETARKDIEEEMHQNGLYEAHVGVATIEDSATHQVTVRFLVDAGKRARYEMPAIAGDTKLPNETIVRATGWRIPLIHRWRAVTAAMTDKGEDGIRKKYAKKDRLTASVNLTSLDYNSHTGRAKANLDIDAGPRINIKALEAKISKGKLRGLVPVYVEGSVDNDLLTEGKKNLQDYFQSRGYPDVDVTFRSEPVKNDQQTITYYIALGPRRKLVHIDILGGDYFTPETIHERMFLQTKSILLRYGRYSETFRKKDEEAIESLYQANGFRDVKVTSSVQTNYKGKADDIAVSFHINAGQQWRVANLAVDGANRLDLSGIQNQLYSAVNQPYADVNVSSDRNRILEYYYDHGFAQAAFSYSAIPGSDPATINLTYHIKEGPREFVRGVIISGLNRTEPSLVTRKIKVRDGEPISITKINDDARRLNDLGVFASVNTGLQDPDGSTLYKYVLYDFDEAARYTFNIGFGLEVGQFGHTTDNLSQAGGAKGIAPIVSFDVSRINFLGKGQTISLQTRYSTLEQRESLNYVVPRFLGSQNRTVTFTLLYDTTQDVQTFSSRREEASVQTSQRLNRASTVLVRFSYSRVSTGNVNIPALIIPIFLQPVRIGMLSASYIQDHRDNPADAHRGFWNTVDAGVAGNFFGSQRNFLRVLARNATYTSLGRNLVFARQTQIGEILPFNIAPGTNPNDVIPLPERFFGGGSVSMRGFGDNQAGPRDIGTVSELPGPTTSTPTGFPIGGNALFFNTFELRFPLLGPNISGVAFHDMGNIYTNFSNLSLGYRQTNIQDFDYAVQAPGFGIRYKTPLGPVRVDLAYALNPPSYDGFSTSLTTQQLIQCHPGQAGNPSYCTPSAQRLSHFEFFFSIGQAF
ncbi:MAG: BamA/TamA family outer membrane protein [Acidobacteriaceae bacterium]|nr:BamA/TamA family outer membrane protein [Acidobacteriaceae bacterium]